jgi:hypothetical protein
MSYPLPKDPAVAAYLKHIKERNVEKSSKCQFCKKPAVGINSNGYSIIFVCENHHIE